MKMYYKIWVSLFLRIEQAQNGNQIVAVILSLIVLVTTNIVNFFLVGYLLITLLGININLMNFENRFVSIAVTVLVFLIPNYFILIFNGKHEKLLKLYRTQSKRNLGFHYFIFSCFLIVGFVFLTILFPHFFGLVKK
jgi:hypothetical protein